MTANTLAQEIESASISFSQLEKEHRPMLKLVEQLIGVVPNCDPLLEIWPTGFRTYNLLVANLLNLPTSLLGGGGPKDLVGLAMYTSSRAAECMYCSAHTCSFAIRRGVSTDAITGDYTELEAAVAAVAEGMARVPADLTAAQVVELRRHLSEDEVEWVILGAALMGFLNKFMDTMGVELEEGAINDVKDLITSTGWSTGKHAWTAEGVDEFLDPEPEGKPLIPGASATAEQSDGNSSNGSSNGQLGYKEIPKDSIGTYMRVMRQAPGALRRDKRWTKGMSSRPAMALMALEEELGYAYNTLASLNHKRVVRAIATVIRDNMDDANSKLGVGPKCLIALVYARVVGNEVLTAEAVQMAERLAPEIGHRKLSAIGRFADADMTVANVPPGLSPVEAAVVMLTKSASPSPSEVNQITISVAAQALTPEQIIEAVVWLSVQQLLHRLYVFYEADNELAPDQL
ncbi:MAG: carboxymuconolactone decarboxylase family protein [Acidimicrobiales bacterium]